MASELGFITPNELGALKPVGLVDFENDLTDHHVVYADFPDKKSAIAEAEQLELEPITPQKLANMLRNKK
jgi:hypothetical protein